jgi:acyl-CoA synthetase (AMP-forming)/AMP-acid ligase II
LEQPIELAGLLEFGLSTKPDATALVSLERSWSWQELDQASNRLGAAYLSLGLAPGDRVASLMPNRGVLLVHYLACFKTGLVATPLNYRYQGPEIDHALQVSGAAILVAHAEREEVLATSEQASELALGRISYGADRCDGCRLEELMSESADASFNFPKPRPEQPAFIFFTSGSTGKPKGVTHSHASFGWIVASSAAGLGLTDQDVFLPATSASHIAATSFSFAGLAAGATVAIARAFGGDELLPLLRRTRPSLLCMLPAPLFGLVRDHGASNDDFRSIRCCVSGGDKIPAELEREDGAGVRCVPNGRAAADHC